ncbi:MAG TPA: hypothetical protein DCM28_10995, partial [Phycisphaerales bacterium]|nr:hypothetical protein [Phycisphaerales bacterium]
MTTRVHDIIGGYGILVSYMAGSYIIELDNAVGPWGGNGGSADGIFDEASSTKLIYTDEHDSEPDGQS